MCSQWSAPHQWLTRRVALATKIALNALTHGEDGTVLRVSVSHAAPVLLARSGHGPEGQLSSAHFEHWFDNIADTVDQSSARLPSRALHSCQPSTPTWKDCPIAGSKCYPRRSAAVQAAVGPPVAPVAAGAAVAVRAALALTQAGADTGRYGGRC